MSTKSTKKEKNRKKVHKVVDILRKEVYFNGVHNVDGGDDMDTVNLRGLVYSKYKTISEFADAVGWKRGKAGRILSGTQEMDVSDIQTVAQALGICSREEFTLIFFPALSTMWTN